MFPTIQSSKKELARRVGQVLWVAVCALLAIPGQADDESRAQVLAAVETLETQPGTEAAKQALVWLTQWLIEAPDLTVYPCPAILGPKRKQKGLDASITIHHMYSQAAYQLENPEADPRGLAVYLAGVEGTLRAYSARRASGMKKHKLLEDLGRMQERGGLESYVEGRLQECK